MPPFSPLSFALTFATPFLTLLALATDWEASNYPNPRTNPQQCGAMATGGPSNVCDPDQLLAQEGREALNKTLAQLVDVGLGAGEAKCDKKGLTAVLAIVEHIKTVTDQQQHNVIRAAKTMADGLMRRWELDNDCDKAIVMVVAIGDRKFWTSRKKRVPIVGTEFTQMFNDQKSLFRSGDYAQALENIVKEIRHRMEQRTTKRADTDN